MISKNEIISGIAIIAFFLAVDSCGEQRRLERIEQAQEYHELIRRHGYTPSEALDEVFYVDEYGEDYEPHPW